MNYSEQIRNVLFLGGFRFLLKAKPEKTYTYADFKLWQRELIFVYLHQHMDHDHSQYAILWEDPGDPDAPAKVTHPAPIWLAMALHGDILPPVEVYHALAQDEAEPSFKRHKRGHLLHDTKPIGPMTEDDAIEYIIKKDLPPSVWRDYKGNRLILRVIKRIDVPADMAARSAWRVDQCVNGVEVDAVEAARVHREQNIAEEVQRIWQEDRDALRSKAMENLVA